MSTPSDDLIAAQRAVIETSQTIGAKSVEAAAKLFELQYEAARLYGGVPPSDIAGNMMNTMTSAARATDYLQQMSSLWLSSGEMVRLLQTQAERTQSWINEWMKASWQNAPLMTMQTQRMPRMQTPRVPPMPTAWPGMPPMFGPRLF